MIRGQFFNLFARAFNDNDTEEQYFVTNVFPLVAEPKFNDNIFVSKNSLSFDDQRVGTLDILAPNLATAMRLEAKKKPTTATRNTRSQKIRDKCLDFAKKIYSDHVHVSVSLSLR